VSDKSPRADWRAWCAPDGYGVSGRPDPRLITRDELLATLEQWGVQTTRDRPVEEATLRYWAAEALIPLPTIDGSPGYERALYAWWVADLIKQLRHYQDGGMKTEQLRTWMRGEAHRLSRVREWRVSDAPQPSNVSPIAPMLLPREFSRAIIPPIARMLARQRTERGLTFTRAEIHLVTTSGETIVYTVGVTHSDQGTTEEGVE